MLRFILTPPFRVGADVLLRYVYLLPSQLTSQLTALELKAEQGEKEVAVEGKVSAASAGETAKAYLSLEEYKAATAKGEWLVDTARVFETNTAIWRYLSAYFEFQRGLRCVLSCL